MCSEPAYSTSFSTGCPMTAFAVRHRGRIVMRGEVARGRARGGREQGEYGGADEGLHVGRSPFRRTRAEQSQPPCRLVPPSRTLEIQRFRGWRRTATRRSDQEEVRARARRAARFSRDPRGTAGALPPDEESRHEQTKESASRHRVHRARAGVRRSRVTRVEHEHARTRRRGRARSRTLRSVRACLVRAARRRRSPRRARPRSAPPRRARAAPSPTRRRTAPAPSSARG